MKIPYIINYIEEVPLQLSKPLYYDNLTQMNYLNDDKILKAVSFTSGPSTTILTEAIENSDDESINLGPDTTIVTDTIENTDLSYCGPSTTEKTATIENADYDDHFFLGPDTTRLTKSTEAADTDYMSFDSETTRQTVNRENSEINTFILGPDTTILTHSVENSDEH